MSNTNGKKSGVKDKIVLEMIAYWINVLYLTTVFSVFMLYKRLILANYDISYSNWELA